MTSMTKTLLAIRHVAFEDLGGFEAPLEEAGYAICYCDMGLDDPFSGPTPDLLTVLGGPFGAYEGDLYPFLKDEIALIATALKRGTPTLGICLGAQLMARALGARVYPGRAKEIGWKPLTLTPEGEALLPDGAVNLASTDICAHQAFAIGDHALAFQFHPEAQARGFERWLIGHACEIAATPGVTVPDLRGDTGKYAAAATKAGRAILQNWLAGLA
jgi:GMP synthase (glutamine-hydrolysing)